MASSLDIVIRATDSGASRVIDGVRGSLKGISGFGSNLLTAPFRGLMGPLGAAVAGLASVGAAVSFVKGSLAEAAGAEAMEVKLRSVAGSAAEAKKRFEEIGRLKLEMPFDESKIVAAEVSLARFTNNAWHGTDALKLCGELAAASSQDIDTMSQSMARTYAEVQSGVSGRGLSSLQMSGLIDPAVKKDLDVMIEKGEKGDVVWQKLTQSLSRFGGNMAAQMNTSAGKMSLLSKMWDDVQLSFGKPVLDSLTPLLDQIKQYLPQIQKAAKASGEGVASYMQMALKAFSDGRLGEFIGRSILYGVQLAGGNVLATFADWTVYLAQALAAAIKAAFNATKNSVTGLFGGEAENNNSWVENFSKDLSKTTKDWGINDGPKTTLRDFWGEVMDDLKKGFVVDFGIKTPVENKTDEPAAATPAPGIERVAGKSKKAKDTEERFSDNYSRIGLFVGGAGVNYQSSIAKNTERSNKLLEATNTHLARIADAGTGAAAWA